jgi:outer membrane receptor for ferrienterochelin and colicins
MKKLFVILLTFFYVSMIFGQKTDAMLFGDVKDENGKHIPFAHILVKGTSLGTAADESGHFAMSDLPLGEVTIVAEAMGYKPQEKKVVMKKNKSTEVYFVLKQDKFMLNEVVVSSSRMGVNRQEAPVMVDVLSPKVFSNTQSATLAEGINFTPGIRVETDCQNCGFSQLRMNGLPGPYTQILVNSKNIFSGLAGVYGLEQIPSAIIKRVEVVRGGGSALFGSNAIGGTVNIITKEPEKNTFEISSNYGVIGLGYDDYGYDKNLSFNVANVTKTNNLGFIAYGMVRDRTPFDANDDGFSEIPLLKTQIFGINSFYKVNSRTKIEGNFRSLHDFRRGGNKLNLLPHEADITEQVEHYITGGDITADIYTNREKENRFSVFTSFQNIHRNSYYGANQDPNGYGYTDNLTTNSGIQYFMNFTEDHKLISGVDVTTDNLEDHKLAQTEVTEATLTNQYKQSQGLFLQDELKKGKFNFSTGLRYENYEVKDKIDDSGDINGNVILPRFSVLYKLNDFYRFRVGYARGYRSPQVFDEDLHVEASGVRRIYHINAPDLKEETSDSYTMSLSYKGMMGFVNTYAVIEGFYTILHDPFTTRIVSLDTNGTMLYERDNASNGAYVRGVNLELDMLPTYNTKFQAGFTLQQARYNKPQQWGDDSTQSSIYILRSPSAYGYYVFDWNIKKHWTISNSGTFTGSMYTPHLGTNPNQNGLTETERNEIEQAVRSGDIVAGNVLVKTPKFFDMAFKIAYTLDLKDESNIEFSVSVKNIFNSYQRDFDKGKYRDSGFIYGPSIPRSIFFGIKYGLD